MFWDINALHVEGWFPPSYVGEHETPTSAQDENASPQSAGEQNNIEYRLASVQYRMTTTTRRNAERAIRVLCAAALGADTTSFVIIVIFSGAALRDATSSTSNSVGT